MGEEREDGDGADEDTSYFIYTLRMELYLLFVEDLIAFLSLTNARSLKERMRNANVASVVPVQCRCCVFECHPRLGVSKKFLILL